MGRTAEHCLLKEILNCLFVLSSRASSFTRSLLNEADGRQAGPPSLVIGVHAATKTECFYLPGTWFHVNPIDANTWRAQKAEFLCHRGIGYLHFVDKYWETFVLQCLADLLNCGVVVGTSFEIQNFDLHFDPLCRPDSNSWRMGHWAPQDLLRAVLHCSSINSNSRISWGEKPKLCAQPMSCNPSTVLSS
jgi:hypothetical protein